MIEGGLLQESEGIKTELSLKWTTWLNGKWPLKVTRKCLPQQHVGEMSEDAPHFHQQNFSVKSSSVSGHTTLFRCRREQGNEILAVVTERSYETFGLFRPGVNIKN